jgi:FkbM family methyltransferase
MSLYKRLSRLMRQLYHYGPVSVAKRIYRDRRLGRQVEALNNRVDYAGLLLDLSNPLISTRMKSTFLTGKYERAELALIERFLPRDSPVVELGASLGVISCFTNLRLDNPAHHVVVEANSAVLPTLQRHRELNGCQFQIELGALAYGSDHVDFHSGVTFLAGSTDPAVGGQTVSVETVSLGGVLDTHQFGRINLIADIEGCEVDLVDNECEVLKAHVHWFIFESHPGIVSSDAMRRMFKALDSAGFLVRAQDEDVFALENTRWTSAESQSPPPPR